MNLHSSDLVFPCSIYDLYFCSAQKYSLIGLYIILVYVNVSSLSHPSLLLYLNLTFALSLFPLQRVQVVLHVRPVDNLRKRRPLVVPSWLASSSNGRPCTTPAPPAPRPPPRPASQSARQSTTLHPLPLRPHSLRHQRPRSRQRPSPRRAPPPPRPHSSLSPKRTSPSRWVLINWWLINMSVYTRYHLPNADIYKKN